MVVRAKLENGRFILASWVPCAGEWYAVEADDPTELTATDIEELGPRPLLEHLSR